MPAPPPACRNMHNNLRITRILKSLGELGFKHYQAPLVRFFLEETLVKKTLSSVKRSVLDYFLFAVLDKEKRQELVRFAYLHFEPKDKFVWCPRKIQKQFRKIEKRSDVVDGKEEAYSRGKSRDGEAGVQQKEDGLDKVPKDQKGVTKAASKDKNASSESSTKTKWEEEAVGNGNVEAESEKFLENGDCAEDVDEMDQSPSPDTVMAKSEPCADGECKSASGVKDTVQEADLMQTDRDAEPEKPPKKKREDGTEVPALSPGPAAGSAVEEKVSGSKPSSSSGQTPLKTSKHSPSPCQGREEKIPRTDFNQVPDKSEDLEMSQEGVSVTNGSPRSSDKEESEQTNGKDCDDVTMESQNSSSSQNMGNS